jgi:hypothetical protein
MPPIETVIDWAFADRVRYRYVQLFPGCRLTKGRIVQDFGAIFSIAEESE